MSKFNLFVVVYSVVMLALFFTFCFLMTRINPPPIKQDPDNLRRYGSDDFIYTNDVLPNDNVAYGLEKVYDDYDSIDVFSKKIIENRKNMPTIYVDKDFETNCTRKEILKMVTRSMKHIKGLRRSINKESQQDGDIQRSVHLKIKDLDGQPRIEIKVVPDKSKSKKIRRYRSSASTANNTLKFYIDNDKTKYAYDKISKEVIVVIENNEKLVLDFAKDSINLYDDNTVDSVNHIIINANKDDTKIINDKYITETEANIYNNTSGIETNTSKTVIIHRTESNQTNIEKTTQSMGKSRTNEVNSVAISFNSVTFIETKTDIELIKKSTKNSNGTTNSNFPSEAIQGGETSPVVSTPVNNLVGLLIPEATATLPFNYHFIN